MKRLNNKGITTIEIIICFILVVGITVSMYSVISSFNEKKITESYKEELTTYKNTLTKTIQDDLIKVGLKSVVKTSNAKVTCTLKDNTTRVLEIVNVNNKLLIKYDSIEYPLPDFGNDAAPVTITNSVISTDNNILKIYIEINHPDFGNKYSINIVDPINY